MHWISGDPQPLPTAVLRCRLVVWTELASENARPVFDALRTFGAPFSGAERRRSGPARHRLPDRSSANRIDILTSIDGVAFAEAWADRVETSYGDQPMFVIGRAWLIRNKPPTGHLQDSSDVAALERSSG